MLFRSKGTDAEVVRGLEAWDVASWPSGCGGCGRVVARTMTSGSASSERERRERGADRWGRCVRGRRARGLAVGCLAAARAGEGGMGWPVLLFFLFWFFSFSIFFLSFLFNISVNSNY